MLYTLKQTYGMDATAIWYLEKIKLELKIFYQTQTTLSHTVHSHHPRQQQNGPICCCRCYLQRLCYSAFSMGRKFVPGDLDLWPWPSNSSKRGTKHVFPMNLAQICSAVPRDILYTNKKNKKVTDNAKNRTLRSLLHVVMREEWVYCWQQQQTQWILDTKR